MPPPAQQLPYTTFLDSALRLHSFASVSIAAVVSASCPSQTCHLVLRAIESNLKRLVVFPKTPSCAVHLPLANMSPPEMQETRPLFDSAPAQGPFVQSSAGEIQEVTERTALLTNKEIETANPVVSGKNIHYHNIDGKRFVLLFVTIACVNTVAFFDTTLMASAHPVITSYFKSSNSASWLSTAFYLTSTVTQPLYGRVSDTIGRRPVYIFAQVMFLVSTIWCALAGDIGSFIAARAICGIGAGGVMSVSNIITSDIVKIEFRGIYRTLPCYHADVLLTLE